MFVYQLSFFCRTVMTLKKTNSIANVLCPCVVLYAFCLHNCNPLYKVQIAYTYGAFYYHWILNETVFLKVWLEIFKYKLLCKCVNFFSLTQLKTVFISGILLLPIVNVCLMYRVIDIMICIYFMNIIGICVSYVLLL